MNVPFVGSVRGSLRKPLWVCLCAAMLGACRHPSVGVEAFPDEVFGGIEDSPLLIDLGTPDLSNQSAPQERVRIGDDQLYNLDLGQAPLGEAIHMIAQRAGVNIYLDDEFNESIDASFPSVTLDDALSTLLERNGLRLVNGPGEIYWVERADGSQPALAEFQLSSIRAEDISSNVRELVGGNTKVVVDTAHNYVMVRGTAGDVNAVEAYLRGVDRLKPQVLIEVHLFEVRLDDSFDYAAQGNSNGTISGDTLSILQSFGTPGAPFSATLTDDDFTLTIQALRRYVALELLSSPRVLAVTNTEAIVEVVEEIPYIETTSTTTGTTAGVGSTVQESVQFKEAGIKLRVTPTIQADGVLQIAIFQELSEVVDTFNEIPVLDTRTLGSSFLVRDRETIVLGGLMQDRHSEVDRGVPLLMHIPLLGQLFRSDADQVEKRELLIFVTSRILDPAQAARLAPHYQDTYRESRGMLVPPTLDKITSVGSSAGVDRSSLQGTAVKDTAEKSSASHDETGQHDSEGSEAGARSTAQETPALDS